MALFVVGGPLDVSTSLGPSVFSHVKKIVNRNTIVELFRLLFILFKTYLLLQLMTLVCFILVAIMVTLISC